MLDEITVDEDGSTL